MFPPQQPITDLSDILPNLNQLGLTITHQAMNSDLPTLLHLIANSARQIFKTVTPSTDLASIAAVVWLYDETTHSFDPAFRAVAGEPAGQMKVTLLQPGILGWWAKQRRQFVVSYQETALLTSKDDIVAVYPLLVGDEFVGLLYLFRADKTHFSQVELLAVENLVNVASLAIYHNRKVGGITQDLTRRVDELEKFWWVAKRINSRANLEETLREILLVSLDMLAAQYGTLELHDKKQGLLRLVATAGYQQTNEMKTTLPINNQSVVGWVAQQGQSLRINDLRTSEWQTVYQPLPVDREMRSELAVPLIGPGCGLEGVLNIESPLANAFTPNDQRLLETIATQAGVALQEIRLLDALHEIFDALLNAGQTELFRLIIDWASDLINVAAGSVWLLAADGRLVVQQSTAGYQVGQSIPLTGSLTEKAIRLKQPVTVDNVQRHPKFVHQTELLAQGWVSVIVVPLLLPKEGRALGSISFFSNQLRDFSNWDKKVLTCLAYHAAIAIQDAEQLAQLRQAQERQAIAETFAAVGDVAANLMHQLNNKMGAIPVQVQAMEDKAVAILAKHPELAEGLETIEQCARQALAIVRDAMTHLHPVKPRPVTVTTCLERAWQRANPPPEIEIRWPGLAELPPVMANEQPLEMVFYNLIDNALEAMRHKPTVGGRLTIQGMAQGDKVAISVVDTGPGISPELLPHIFEFRLPHHTRSTEGLGFGLWWVKTFVDRFGGQLQVDSQLGQGTTVTVYLPAVKT